MKQNNLFRKTLLLALAIIGGVSTMWADPAATFSIPQNLGSYILIGQDKKGSSGLTADGVTLTGCTVDGNGACYTVGNTNGTTVTIQLALTAEAGSYLFAFKSGAMDASIISLSLTNSSSEVVWSKANEPIEDTNSWSLTKSHNFVIGNLAAGSYTMTITGVSKTGSYYGNFGNFSFHKSTQYADNWNNTSNIIFTDAENSGNSISNDWINSITKDSYVEFYTFTPAAGFYYVNAKYGYATAGTDNFTMTITDVATSTVEVNADNYKVNASETYPIANSLAMGWKKIRIDYPSTPASGSFRCQGMKFGAYDFLPLTDSGNTLNLSQGVFGTTGSKTPTYEDANKNIGNCKHGGYAIYYVGNTYETGYYSLSVGIKKYNNGGTLKVTVTDVATSTTEIDGEELVVTSGSNYELQTLKLSSAITSGLKQIRFDFIKPVSDGESDNFLFNFNNVTFYKRSLNEAEDYTPVAATGVDITLTRTINADKWSTIVLPFSISKSDLETALGTTVTLAGISGYNSGTHEISTESLSSITANVPCFIKTNSDVSGEATISNVTIAAGTAEKVISGDFKLIGSYSAMDIPSGCYFVSNNNLYKSTGNSHIKPFRAYFTGVPAGARIMFWDDEDATAVTDVRRDVNDVKGEYFDLQGRKVANPTKGLYIVNGKKVIIR